MTDLLEVLPTITVNLREGWFGGRVRSRRTAGIEKAGGHLGNASNVAEYRTYYWKARRGDCRGCQVVVAQPAVSHSAASAFYTDADVHCSSES